MGNVMLGYLHRENISSSFHKSYLAFLGHDISTSRYLHSWGATHYGTGGIPEGRNQLCENVVDSPERHDLPEHIEWLFMLDDDMGFEPDLLDRLMASADPTERPIIGGLCFTSRQVDPDTMGGFRVFPQMTILDWKEREEGGRFEGRDHYPVNTLIRAGATGAACLLIHRSVLERMMAVYGRCWFDRVPGWDGRLMGEDISFFARLMALDIPLYVNTGARTSHMKPQWVAEQDWWDGLVPPPATERIDVIVPVLHRPQNVKPLVESLRASTGLADVWFVCDPDDAGEIAEVVLNDANVLLCEGSFAKKANFAYAQTTRDWLMLVGDDVTFEPGWLDHAMDVARRYNGSLIATNDLHNPMVLRGMHATHPIIRRAWVEDKGASFDGPGHLCHDGYGHCFVDNEWTAKATLDGVFQAALGSRVAHNHPIWRKDIEDDAIYQLGQSTLHSDADLFNSRVKQYMEGA